MEKKALTALLKGRTIVSVQDNSGFRADQISIVLDNGASLQLTYEPPILSYKVIKVTAEEVLRCAERIIEKHPSVQFYTLTTKHRSNPIQVHGLPNLNGYNLEDISDKIYNAKVFISLSSGLHSLAAAIQRINPYFSQYCILPASKYDFFMKTKLFIYPNVIYIQEG